MAGIRKQVTASRPRDVFVVRSIKRGMKVDAVIEMMGLAKTSYEDARKKYGRFTKEAV